MMLDVLFTQCKIKMLAVSGIHRRQIDEFRLHGSVNTVQAHPPCQSARMMVLYSRKYMICDLKYVTWWSVIARPKNICDILANSYVVNSDRSNGTVAPIIDVHDDCTLYPHIQRRIEVGRFGNAFRNKWTMWRKIDRFRSTKSYYKH